MVTRVLTPGSFLRRNVNSAKTVTRIYSGARFVSDELRFNVPSGVIAAKSWGCRHGAPILVGLHGYLDNAASFDNLAPFLCSQGYSFVSLDLPGHGLSSHRLPSIQHHYFFNNTSK